jgi:hypothetical protein
MQRLIHCGTCGTEVPNDAAYCPNCGSKISLASSRSDWNWRWNKRDYYSHRREDDWWGLVTAAGFFIVIGLTIAAYPDVFNRVVNYFQSFETYGHPVLPSYNLWQVLIYFFNLSGIWGLIAAALRFFITSSGSRAARDGVGALFSLYTANILTQFYSGAFGGWALVGMWIVGLVVVIVADALITFFVPRRISLYAR